MPKRQGNLFDQTFTLDRMYQAYFNARKGKRKTLSVARFERDLGANLVKLQTEILNGTYQPAPYRHFVIYSPKARNISAPSFRDVVAQHAIHLTISPIFEATFLKDSYGCRIGGGAHRASDSLQNALRKASPEAYILQMDIRKFYYRVDHEVLHGLFKKKIKDLRLLELMMVFVKDGDLAVGLPIGNLLSQLYALIYLNALDHYAKRDLKLHNYARYVDDFIMVLPTKQEAKEVCSYIKTWLAGTLKLELSKATITPIRKGANFVGFRTWRSRRFVRKRSLHRFSKSLKDGRTESLVSIIGNAYNTSTLSYFTRRLSDERPDIVLPNRMRSRLCYSHTQNLEPQALTEQR